MRLLAARQRRTQPIPSPAPAGSQESSMIDLSKLNVWFVTGSQHLYGDETLQQVAAHAQAIAAALGGAANIPVDVVFKPVVTTPESILDVCRQANNAPDGVGLIFWMHTFSPAKMWITG